MIYKILFCVGSLIILVFLYVSYNIALKRINNIVFRQKVFKFLFFLAFISISMDISELFFYYKGPDILYKISWYLHWIISDTYYFMIALYSKLLLGLDDSKNWKEL
jgi:hypothetical protein